MKFKNLTLALCAALLSACASHPINFNGQSLASPQLKNDVTKIILMTTNAKGCPTITKIDTSVTQEPTGKQGSKESKEFWRAYGCDAEYNFNVKFKEDGSGGAYFGVVLAKE